MDSEGYEQIEFTRVSHVVEKPVVKKQGRRRECQKLRAEICSKSRKSDYGNEKYDEELANAMRSVVAGEFDELPIEWYAIKEKLSTRFGLLLMDDRIVVPQSFRQLVLHLLHAGHIGVTKMKAKAAQFWWRDMEFFIHGKARRYRPCNAAGKSLKSQIPSTEKIVYKSVDRPGQEIQLDFTGNLTEYGGELHTSIGRQIQ